MRMPLVKRFPSAEITSSMPDRGLRQDSQYMSHTDLRSRIATIINFCTIDYKFIGHCIRAVLPFSEMVVVPYADRLFNNTVENRELIETAKRENTAAVFKEFQYHHSITENIGANFWHNYARWVGVASLPADIEFVLFLDADEIVESERFIKFVQDADFTQYDYLYLANYWYFREPIYRARNIEISPVLAKKSIISSDILFLSNERGNFSLLPNGARGVLGMDHKPMIHHYSWVRSKQEMLSKVRTWAHKSDRDWVSLVEEEFSHEFNGTDFVHGYEYDIVEPYISFESAEDFDQNPNRRIDPDLRRKYGLNRENINQIDLSCFSKYVANLKHRNYFFDVNFKEHYRLTAYLSTLFNNSVIFDIGTNLGYSALALSYNDSNRIISYDIVECRELNHHEELTNIEFVIGDVCQDERALYAPLIMLDTNHDGEFENRFYEFLKENGYRGLLFLDDIHLNQPMMEFWDLIEESKDDLTDLGHWSGSGLVDFSQ